MFLPSVFREAMQELTKQAHQNSIDKGFWTGPDNDNIPTKLCLMHSEISEWLEAFRKGNPPCDKNIEIYPSNPDAAEGTVLGGINARRITSEEEEAADLFIRLLDLCGKCKIDLAQVTLAKMDYNSRRPHMHGGKKV